MSMNQPQIEAKNLTILEDQMKHEALAYKKCELYSQYFTDPALKSSIAEIAHRHRQHFTDMFNYLNSHQ